MKILILVGLGGALGSIMRYLITHFVISRFSGLSAIYATFTVNFIGCLLIGIIFGLSERYDWFSPQWNRFAATGICGGFTTFSAFALENVNLLQGGNYCTSFAYTAASVVICLAATFAGIIIAR